MKKILPFVIVFFIIPNVQAEEQKQSQAYEEQLIERVRSVFSLEAEKVEIERPICATPIFLEVKANWDRLSATTRKLLQQDVQRPTFGFPEYTYDTPEGHFKIHYVRQGDSAVYNPDADYNVNGHPDWVDTVGMVLEYVWETEIYVLGYNPPPSDIANPDTADNGGDGRYDVYLVNMALLGYTQGEYVVAPPASATSYIVLDNDYAGFGSTHSRLEWLQVTAAHEFFHAVQLGYDGAEYEIEGDNVKPYWMEMSAVWMEEMVYDGVDDYLGYLPSFFKHPDWSLKTFTLDRIGPYGIDSLFHAYGSCVWPMYLQERFNDTTIIREIWRECAQFAGDNAISYSGGESATDKALKARGATFEEAFREFTVWNYFTGSRERTQVFYSEGNLFPEINVEHSHDFQSSDTVYSPSGPNHPYGLGANYVVFEHNNKQGGVRLSFSPASEEYDFEISAVGFSEIANEPIRHEFQINHQTGAAEAEVWNWTSYNKIIMIPASVERDGGSYFPYIYSAVYDSSLHGDQPFPQRDWIGQNFPNPFVVDDPADLTYFPFVLSSVSEVEIEIFAASGERVWHYPPDEKKGQEWTIGEYTERGKCPAWNGKNESGEYVAAGVYIYQVKTKNSKVVRKLAVIR
ncbi:MAG: hypothetical protein GTO24_10765 [candidate division Zixibacteria bacterium]|nr:hypothetical protein [candidate division Zixibacteria bacterium]